MKLIDLLNNISSELNFEFDKEKKLGHLRCQYGSTNQIANQFVSTELFADKSKNNEINLNRIQEVVNVIQFNWIENFKNLENLCKGEDWSKEETNYFFIDENINYWIRLIPQYGTSEYNCYINVYHA
jgi:hypothetical protein